MLVSIALGAFVASGCSNSGSPLAPVNLATPAATPVASPSPSASSLPAPSPTPTQPALALFVATGYPGSAGTGVIEYNAANGSFVDSFASNTAADDLGIDGLNNVYLGYYFEDIDSTQKFAIGGNTALATYQPTNFGFDGQLVVASTGELVLIGYYGTSDTFDEWDPGASGPASRSFNYPTDSQSSTAEQTICAFGEDGTLYIPYESGGVEKIDVIAPKSSTVEKTLTDSLAPSPASYFPAAMSVAADGTLYVGEYNASVSTDPDAGMYVFSPSGAESLVKTMASNIAGIGFDSSQNAYVVSAAGQLSMYSPHGASMLRQSALGLNVYALLVSASGTAYMISDHGVYDVAPAATSATELIANSNINQFALYSSAARTASTGQARSRRRARSGFTNGMRFNTWPYQVP